MFVYAGLFDVCIHVFIGFSYVYMYMFIGLFYVRKYMYIGPFSVCRICEEKNGRQRELQRKVMKNDGLFESESTRARVRERACPPEKLLGDGVSTPMPIFCLICTIISNKTCILD